MGTRAATVIKDDGKFVTAFQRTTDGYPRRHGKELVDFLKNISMVNGLQGDRRIGVIANGMGCLAAQLICRFKDKAGFIYVMSQEEYEEEALNDYDYIIEGSTVNPAKGITLIVDAFGDTLFKGHPKDCDIDAIEEKLEEE